MQPTLTVVEPKKITLTEHQEEQLEKLINWHHGNSLFFTLKGSAGVGKTTVLREFIARCRFSRSSIAVTAPTHKAKKVVETSTGLEGHTIHSILGLRPNTDIENFNINNPQFDQMADALISFYKLLIIDEASMLNEDLHKLICNEANLHKTRVLFVGDILQLPPVNERISKSLTEHEAAELLHVIRQAGDNPLMDILVGLRSDILENKDSTLKILKDTPTKFNERDEGYTVYDRAEFTNKVIELYNTPEFDLDPDYCRVTAWTNESVTAWNHAIRQSKNSSSDKITKGDLLMGYNTVADERNIAIVVNSEDYIVEECSITKTEEDIVVYNALITSNGYGQSVVNIVHPDGLKKFLDKQQELHKYAQERKGRAWVEYYKFKNRYLLQENIYQNNRLLVKKDLDYGYAITVHKTQGSTYKNVFVVLANILRNRNLTDRRKLAYVALSRASQKSFILNPTI